MKIYTSIARHEGLILRTVANVADGWQKNEGGYGAYGSGSLDYPGDRSIEITMNVRVRPLGSLQPFPNFPADIDISGDLFFEGIAGLGFYLVARGKAGVLVAIGALKDELEKKENEPIYFDKVILKRGPGSTHIRLKSSVCLRSTPPEPVGDIPEWDTQFFQGGLPSLGKRRP